MPSCCFIVQIPPTPAGTIPIFFQAGFLEKTQLINADAPDSLDSYSVKLTTDPIPLLLSISKQATVSQLENQIRRILTLSREHRIRSNLSDKNSILRYSDLYSTIYVDMVNYVNSVFFEGHGVPKENESGSSEEGSVSKEGKTVKEDLEGNTPETVSETNETVSETNETPSTTNETASQPPEHPPLQFPRFYCLSLSLLSQQTIRPSTLLELTSAPSTTTLLEAFSSTDNKTDYRCVYLATRVRGATIASSFSFSRCQDANAVLNSFAAAVRCDPAPIAYTEDQAVEDAKSRGRKPALEKPKQLQLTDCLELKKPSTVMLTGSGCVVRECAEA